MTEFWEGLEQARAAIGDLCTGAVLERWRWWRPSWSAGQYHGLREALDAIERLQAKEQAETSGWMSLESLGAERGGISFVNPDGALIPPFATVRPPLSHEELHDLE